HVGVALPAGAGVHDPLLEQGVVDAHDDAAGDLRLAGQLVDDQAAVLHRPEVGAADHAGFGVHGDLGDLHAADAAGVVRVRRRCPPGLWVSAGAAGRASVTGCMPSRGAACRHGILVLVAVFTTTPGSMRRLPGWVLSRLAIAARKLSRAAVDAASADGAIDGQ